MLIRGAMFVPLQHINDPPVRNRRFRARGRTQERAMKVPKLLRTTALAAGLIAAVPSLSVPANAAWGGWHGGWGWGGIGLGLAAGALVGAALAAPYYGYGYGYPAYGYGYGYPA